MSALNSYILSDFTSIFCFENHSKHKNVKESYGIFRIITLNVIILDDFYLYLRRLEKKLLFLFETRGSTILA